VIHQEESAWRLASAPIKEVTRAGGLSWAPALHHRIVLPGWSKIVYSIRDFFEVRELRPRKVLELLDELFGSAIAHSDRYQVFFIGREMDAFEVAS
jgi:hypothetical protein